MYVSWVKFRNYSGCKIAGEQRVPKPETALHMDRAYYLTALIEAPVYGAVQSYDGAAMSAGPLHNIAVLPRTMTQGSLFSLLRAVELTPGHLPPLLDLWQAYRDEGWAVTQDGRLRSNKDGRLISGQEIRNTFTPQDGRVPKQGLFWERAKKWAVLHYRLFSDPKTFDVQKDFAIDYLIRTQRDVEKLFYGDKHPKEIDVKSGDITPEEDLAMSAYHCYSVNAPAPAKRELINTLQQSKRGKPFAATLLKNLRENTFGNWEVRYVRTRKFAMRSELWPESFFVGKDALFPPR